MQPSFFLPMVVAVLAAAAASLRLPWMSSAVLALTSRSSALHHPFRSQYDDSSLSMTSPSFGPFATLPPSARTPVTNENDSRYGPSQPQQKTTTATTKTIKHNIHLVVTVHGFLGNANEMAYLQHAMENRTSHHNPNNSDDNDTIVLYHAATCNEGRTFDGVAAGGQRLAAEINEWVKAVVQSSGHGTSHSSSGDATTIPAQEQSPFSLSLSIVGNSLGGLYARYALSQIDWNPTIHSDQKKNDSTSSGTTTTTPVQLTPAVFCTTATPHLGVAAPHTYLPLGSTVQRVVARGLGQTGADLFRHTSLLRTMTIDPAFVDPLARFAARWAVANTHQTDWMVSCGTAAFLTTTTSGDSDQTEMNTDSYSDARHHIVPRTSRSGLIPLVVQTKPHTVPSSTTTAWLSLSATNNNIVTQTLASDELARRLDALGWTKVFVDIRPHLASVPLPAWLSSSDTNSDTTNDNIDNDDTSFFTSNELYQRLDPSQGRALGQLHAPLGHTVLVANSKTEWLARLNAGGRPVMQELADELVSLIVRPSKMDSDRNEQS